MKRNPDGIQGTVRNEVGGEPAMIFKTPFIIGDVVRVPHGVGLDNYVGLQGTIEYIFPLETGNVLYSIKAQVLFISHTGHVIHGLVANADQLYLAQEHNNEERDYFTYKK